MATDDAPNLRRLARQLVDVTRRLKHLETVPQLAHSSLDDHGMPVYDADGNLTVTIGKQADGTWGAPPVKGPVPPQPAGVEAEGDAGVIRASWQGVFWAGAAKPMDFEAVEVLVDGTVYAGIHDPQGGSVSVPALGGVRTVSFRTLSQAGVVSAAMGHVQVTVEPRVSEQMQELHENLDELNDVTLPELRDDLTDSAEDLQGKLDNLNARVDDLIVDGGGSGNFTTYSINEPSGVGTGEGDQWFRVVNGEVLGQWRWDGSAWQAVTLTDAIIAGIDLSKLVSNGNLSEIVANKMFTDLFAANKITSQEIAAGSITTEKIAAEGIVADVIQGGSFVGETFEGGSFTGGLFKTSDDLPGKLSLSDSAFRGGPGIEIEPAGGGQYKEGGKPGIGPSDGRMYIWGGQRPDDSYSAIWTSPEMTQLKSAQVSSGPQSFIQTAATAASMIYRPVGATSSSQSALSVQDDLAIIRSSTPDSDSKIVATSNSAHLRSARTGTGGSDGVIHASPREVYLRTSADGTRRYLTVDADGIWVKTNAGLGGLRAYNLEETAQDSGWINIAFNSGFQRNGSNAPFQYRRVGNLYHLRGRIQRTSGTFVLNTSYNIGSIPSADGPSYLQRTIVGSGPATSWCRVDVSPGGNINVAFTDSSANSPTWMDLAGTYWTSD